MYVRVVGTVKDWQGERNINGFRLLPVGDFNEITFHMLDTIHVHLSNTRGPIV
jgi:replication factor A2